MTDSEANVRRTGAWGVPDRTAKDIIAAGRALWERAEPGFFEHSTHDYLTGLFRGLGFDIEEFDGMPGFIARLPGLAAAAGESAADDSAADDSAADDSAANGSAADGRGPRAKRPPGTPSAESSAGPAAMIADMDALPVPGDPDGAYIHSCGHHMQMTALYGAARILSDAGSPALPRLAFIAVPAEEYIDFPRREPLKAAGAVSRLSGKLELLYRGALSPFSRIVSTHGAAHDAPLYIGSVRGMGGFRVMRVRFIGRSAHAGTAQYRAVNAQNAAALFLQACAFLRETFHDADRIRIHPVISLPAGQSVNIVPDSASVETYVRGATPEGIAVTAEKLAEAAEGCARAIGASVEVEIDPGYAPFVADESMHELAREIAEGMDIPFIDETYGAAASDMGDVSQAFPSVMLGLPGSNGLFHNPDFRIIDESAAFVLPSAAAARYLERLVAISD